MSSEQAEFRKVMGWFATGVTVVTTRVGNRPYGLTANAVTSVSLNPPLILVCVDHQADSFAPLSESGAFAVNILSEQQEELSRRFAQTGIDKFSDLPYRQGTTGSPILEGVLGFLECRVVKSYVAGDHTIFIGEVQALGDSGGRPLLFFGGQYTRLSI